MIYVRDMLRVEKVTKRFGGVKAVDSVSLTISESEIVGLIGPNGAGKSTLINLISGVIKPDQGHIYLNDLEITNLEPYQIRKMGLARTFQNVRIFEDLSIIENLKLSYIFGNKSRKISSSKIDDILKTVSLNESQKKAGSLNTADKKKLMIAMALASEPRIILLDEVMAGLSLDQMEGIISIIHDLKKRKLSVLIVEHIMDVIGKITDRVIVMNQGRKIAEGSFTEVLNNKEVIDAYIGG
jgi:ABC-type branched-subunit amino acid transport system ATPase component